jgi:tetratricopeptide (TPR) repeat protein
MRRTILVGTFALLVVASIGALRPASEHTAQMPPAWVDGGHPSAGPAPEGMPKALGKRGALALLRNREFDRLGQLVESQQTQFETEPRSERALAQTLDAFGIADPALTPLLDAWVTERPHDWAPLLVRSRHRIALAEAGHGGDDADESSPSERDARRATLRPAVEDATAALALNHRLAQAYVTLITAARESGDREATGRFAGLGLAIAPASVFLRVQHATSLLPRWGGSYEAVAAFAQASQTYASQVPALHALLGFADWDRGRVLGRRRQFAEALTFLDRAVTTGDCWQFYRDRGETYVRMQRHEAAADDLDRAAALAPEEPDVLTLRAEALAGLGRRADALESARRAAELDPTNRELAWFRRHGAEDAVAQGWDFIRTHDLRAAIERYSWANDLAGGDVEALYWRGRAHLLQNDPTRALADFEEAIHTDPHHIESYRRADELLAQRKDWDAIARLWSRYIELDPSSGVGYVERSAAYRQKGDRSAALADARQACRLGNQAGCETVDRSAHGG